MGDREDSIKPRRTVFVTVGTTCFDSLVKAVDNQEVQDELLRRGFTDLVIQMGRGSYIPRKNCCSALLIYVLLKLCGLFEQSFIRQLNNSNGEDGSLVVDYFTFSSSIADYLQSTSLVISHAGSGSIFESLRLGKPLIVVVNEELMDNHQSELAEELAERKHLYCARPHTLHHTIAHMDFDSLLPYTPGNARPVVSLINKFLGFPDD